MKHSDAIDKIEGLSEGKVQNVGLYYMHIRQIASVVIGSFHSVRQIDSNDRPRVEPSG